MKLMKVHVDDVWEVVFRVFGDWVKGVESGFWSDEGGGFQEKDDVEVCYETEHVL